MFLVISLISVRTYNTHVLSWERFFLGYPADLIHPHQRTYKITWHAVSLDFIRRMDLLCIVVSKDELFFVGPRYTFFICAQVSFNSRVWNTHTYCKLYMYVHVLLKIINVRKRRVGSLVTTHRNTRENCVISVYRLSAIWLSPGILIYLLKWFSILVKCTDGENMFNISD